MTIREEGALSGIRVLDFTHFIAGPYCTMLLGDLGAQVIKVESPGGDSFRQFRPHVGGEGGPFLGFNRNKKGLCLDLRQAAAQEVARELVAKADVLVENFSTGIMDRYGLGYDAVAEINPRLVYCSATAYGRTGSLAARAGFDPVVQAETGFMSMNGQPEIEPTRTGPAVMDVSTGMMAANAVLAALVARTRTGRGQYVEVALFDTAVNMLGFHGMSYLVSGVNPLRFGNMSADSAPMGMFHAADGPFYIGCANDGLFRKLAEALARPDLLCHPDYATAGDRVQNRHALAQLLDGLFAASTREDWVARLQSAGVPAGVPKTIAEAMRSPEMAARGLVSRIPHPTAGEIPNVAPPFRLAGTPVVAPVAGPVLGQHTSEILSDVLAFDAGRIAALVAAGAVRQAAI
ncbi:CaiB/BaiF CoA transferase family protein [Aquabacter spiritensis]|uniref:Formyl-CoA transferase n=1 Tax=Aquabacter spiritensis TaxID=933073 RepID=A0A4R3LTH3_9HYPH|nr:CoA transferase [Aquabacter spiritensis]TCT03853.1 formyl-CoA transferase [Aquabacter spiritensis]